MKYILLIVTSLLSLKCTPQDTGTDKSLLSIPPGIDKNREGNELIISTLQSFLKTKNESATNNEFWYKDDFKKFVTPYLGIYNIEQSRHGENFYKPSLMEIIETRDSNKKIVKLAFVGHNTQTKENTIRCVYNLVANINKEYVLFSSYIDYATQDWKTETKGSINYIISPLKAFNQEQAEKQEKDVEIICDFFKCSPINITYYSCVNPVELFQIKGFDYNPMMYVSANGGLAEQGNIIFSGNNSEYYTHEIVHIYVHNLYPNAPQILNEGIAAYLGGSGIYDYQWHKKKFKQYFENHKPNLNAFIDDPFLRLYIDNETPVGYMVGALICEKIINDYGKEKLISLLRNESNLTIWDLLKQVGITKENLNNDLLKSLD